MTKIKFWKIFNESGNKIKFPTVNISFGISVVGMKIINYIFKWNVVKKICFNIFMILLEFLKVVSEKF